MVAAGAARQLLQSLRKPRELGHPWDIYWIWVFSTDKRLWSEARRRYLDQQAAELYDEQEGER